MKMKTHFKTQAKLFFENSSLHGVKYVAESGRSIIERAMWVIWIVTGIITTTIIIINLWDKFQTNPTITGLDTDFHNWEVAFPAVTICQQNPSNNEKIKEYLLTQYDGNDTDLNEIEFYQKLTQLSLTSWFNFTKEYSLKDFIDINTDIKEFIFNLTNKCEDIFKTCRWKSSTYNCCDIFYPVFTENGFCYIFNSEHYDRNLQRSDNQQFIKHYIRETDLQWSLMFEVQSIESPFAIYIQNNNEITSIDTNPTHIWDFKIETILFSVKQTYTTEDTSQLNLKQRRCAFPNEIDVKLDESYSYSACMTECRMKRAVRLCSCVPFFYPLERTNYRHCTINELDCITENINKLISVKHCNCPLGCLHTVYEIEKLYGVDAEFDQKTTSLETKFVSWPMVRYKREVLFGWVDLLVSFGGIAGLFLGFSLLSAVEILYYFTIRIFFATVGKQNKSVSSKFINKYRKEFIIPIPIQYYDNKRRLSPIFVSRKIFE